MIEFRGYFKNSFFLSVGSAFPVLASFSLVAVYTKYLSPEEYGYTDLISTFVAIAVPVFSLQIYDGLQMFLLKKKAEASQILTNVFVVIVLGLFLSLSFYPLLEYFFLDFTDYLFIILIITSIRGVALSYFIGLDKVKYSSFSSIIESSFLVVFSLFFIVYKQEGVNGFFYSLIISRGIALFFLLVSMRVWEQIKLNFISLSQIKELLKYSAPLVLNLIGWWINSSADRFMILSFNGIKENGIYAAASKLPTLLLVVNSALVSSWTITALKNYDRKNTKMFSDFFNVYFFIMFVMLIFSILFNELFFNYYIRSSEYSTAKAIVPVLIIALFFAAFSKFYGVIYLGEENTKGASYTTVLCAVLNIILNLIFLPILGGMGAAIATLLSFFCIALIRYFYVVKYTKIRVSLFQGLIVLIYLSIVTLFIFSVFSTFVFVIINIVFVLFVFYKHYFHIKKFLSKKA
ncbi:polysaccharide biosynthesis C-terminal domain-containing protein [Cytophagales bacterium LB-30]|uniref:Polysaccharide biosynthesis C-terminal domain-containing protein n=1 Tax=Shiella aurantiaca TaxID=3058365 RepID=A0ABT8F2E6_9BACT|nr:oligosaccharide flippase family protein [Shiella aurantiaca]MDN4164626.1 polysaccharide biosynthesis C-terminal domain-containing protein [Shiella aurantiaca]